MSTIGDEFKRLQEEVGAALNYPGPASVVAALIIADAIGALLAEVKHGEHPLEQPLNRIAEAIEGHEARIMADRRASKVDPPQRPLPSEPFKTA
jgi:hypothetical protein